MGETKIAPYGSWKSPITSDLIVSGTIGFGEIRVDGGNVYWTEKRPSEGGRSVIVLRTLDGKTVDITPPPFNVRTRVHEYGGGEFNIFNNNIYFSNFSDQCLYFQTLQSSPQSLTKSEKMCYADGIIDHRRKRLIYVREDHTISEREAVNSIVSIDLAGGSGVVLVSGNDFYSTPRLSPDGSKLAWLTWNNPNMPWDCTELWVSEVNEDGSLGKSEMVAGDKIESIFQPEWSPDGHLFFISDRTGWWNIYCSREGKIESLYAKDVEFGSPQWVFGMSTYGFESEDRIICTFTENGIWRLASLDIESRNLNLIESPFTEISGLRVVPGKAYFIAGSPTEPLAVVEMNLETNSIEVLRRSSNLKIDPGYLSVPRDIEFPTEEGLTSHAFFYAPQNQDYSAPVGEKPPLIVMSHGGPTSDASTQLNLSIQYWTSRGFGVLDVNYGGSTGYGRSYRERLNGKWGIVDVDDCSNGALFLFKKGEVDGDRLIIRGGSAGGYTTLAALTFKNVFKAGASYYGISDLEALEQDSHKFEARYSHSLIGPYPERKDLYKERSPIHFTDRLSCPIILFQGLEDKVVPPNQAEMMFEAVRAKGLPVAYVPFEGEQHGFRKAENIKRALDAELYFYSKIFGFELADPIDPVKIENL
jgi:dipeptidyl aminopeptidase/acylaminoacyl peptidase